jgi:hypothetical protein
VTAFDRYFEAARATLREHPEQRPGQAAYNTLAVLHPDLAEQVHGTERDPFYIDKRLPAFFLFCREHLHVEGS